MALSEKIKRQKLSPRFVKNILGSLGFEIIKEGVDELRIAVPFHKPDISLPADIVEEIVRIDGLDNIEIPESHYPHTFNSRKLRNRNLS